MKTRNDLRRQLQDAFDKIYFICCLGEFYSGLEATEIAHDAYVLACRHGCVIEMSKLKTDHDALRLVGMLLAWATPTPEALTVQQAAEKLGVSPRTIYDLCDAGRLKCQRIGTGRGTIRIRPADLDAYANNSSSGGDGIRRLIRR